MGGEWGWGAAAELGVILFPPLPRAALPVPLALPFARSIGFPTPSCTKGCGSRQHSPLPLFLLPFLPADGMGWWLLAVGLLLCLLLRFTLRSPAPPLALPPLHGRTAVVTGERGAPRAAAWLPPADSQLSVVLSSAGGSSGIGEAAARQLARCGARVVLATRSALRGEEAARRIRRVRAGGG